MFVNSVLEVVHDPLSLQFFGELASLQLIGELQFFLETVRCSESLVALTV